MQVPKAKSDEPVLLRAQSECVRALHGGVSCKVCRAVLPRLAAGKPGWHLVGGGENEKREKGLEKRG